MPKIYSKGIKVKDGNGVWHDLPNVVSEESMRAAEDARASSAAAERFASEAEAAAEYASQWPAYEAMEAAQEAAASSEQAAASAADAVRALAVVEGQFPEGIATAVTEWLDDNVDPTGSAVTVDSSLLIEGSAADAKETGDNIRYNTHKVWGYDHAGDDSTVGAVTWSWDNGVLTYSGTSTGTSYYYYYENASALPLGIEAGGKYRIRYDTTDKRVCLMIQIYLDGATTTSGSAAYYFEDDGILVVPENATGMKIMSRVTGAGFSVDGAVRQFDVLSADANDRDLFSDPEYKSDCHGVREIKVRWHQGYASQYTNGYLVPASSVANYEKYVSSDLVRIPEEGLYLYFDAIFPMVVRYWKIDANKKIVPATDYVYYYSSESGYQNSTNAHPRYLPYAEGVYANFYVQGASATDASDVESQVHVFCGKITESGGRLPNLSCCAVAGKYASGVKENQKLYFYPYYGSKTPEAGSGSINTTDFRAKYYVACLRLRDVSKIAVAPPYSAVARIYRIDNDQREISVEDEIFPIIAGSSGYPNRYEDLAGQSVIDLTPYDFDGFVLLGIAMEPQERQMVSGTTKYLWSYIASNGMLARYDDVMNHVFVEWKPGVSVTYDAGAPATAKTNIQTVLDNVYATDMQASPPEGGYGNWSYNTEGAMGPFGAKGEVHGWWYNGINIGNVPHMHVTPKSFITASKNHHSRVYIARAAGTQYSINENMYGSVCSATAGFVCGAPMGYETSLIASGLIPDFECRELSTIDDVRPGDFVAAVGDLDPDAGGNFGHVNFVTEVVTVNGETFCVNVFEGAMPWLGFRTYVNLEAYDGYTVIDPETAAGRELLEYFSSRYLEDKAKVVLARLPSRKYKSLRNAYGPYDTQDYDVTEIMCDRGTDAVYGIGEYMTLFVTDGTTEIELYKDGTFVGAVDLTEYPVDTYTDGKVYTVTGMIESAGYYEIYAGDPSVRKESFFVPTEKYYNVVYDTANNKVKISFDPNEEDDEVVCIAVYYEHSEVIDGETVTTSYPRPYFDYDADTVDGSGHANYEVPMTITLWDEKEYSANGKRVMIIRKTPYGTYVCHWFSAVTKRQRAGHPFAK